jgi:hypothetical protein
MSLPSHHHQLHDNGSAPSRRFPYPKRPMPTISEYNHSNPSHLPESNGLVTTHLATYSSDSGSSSGVSPDSDSDGDFLSDFSSNSSYLSSHRRRKIKTTILTQLVCTAAFLGFLGFMVHSRITTSTVPAPFGDSAFGRSGRQMLVVPYCGLSNRLTLMIESLSLSRTSGHKAILNWLVDEDGTGEFSDIFDEGRSPFNTIYVNADLPESIDPSKKEIDGTLMLTERDIPGLSSNSRGVDFEGSFIERNSASLAKRLWNRKHGVNGVSRKEGQAGQGEGVIIAGCREGGLEDVVVGGGGHGPASNSKRHVEQAMKLFSSVKCNILTAASKFNTITKLNKKQNKLGLVVGVSISSNNSPFNKDGSWTSTEEELKLYDGNSLLYVSSDDEALIKWFCGKYRHVVALDRGGRTDTEDKLLDLLNLGNADYVIGDRGDSFSRLAKWMSQERIVRNVLQQQRRVECVQKIGSEVFMSHDFNQCSYESGIE